MTYVPVPEPRGATRDRHAPRPDDFAGAGRLATDEAKAISKQRAATAECVNGQARDRGLTPFLVRGIAQVKAVAIWHALAHNMACSWRLAAA